MRKAIAGAVTLATLTVAIQSIAQTPPPAPVMPPSLPAAHVVNLMTNEGSGAFGVQWRIADVRIVEVPAAINKDRYKTTYQLEPRAMPTDFDDSQWERIEGKDQMNEKRDWAKPLHSITPSARASSGRRHSEAERFGR